MQESIKFYSFSLGTILHVFYRSQIDIKTISIVANVDFFLTFSVFSQNRAISRSLDHYWQCKIQIKKIQTINDILSMPFTVFSVHIQFSTFKGELKIYHNKLCTKVTQRLRIFGTYEIKRKSQNSMQTQATIQSLLQNLIFKNSSQNLRKSRYHGFLVDFLTFGKVFLHWLQQRFSSFEKRKY